jgi:chromosome segregation ATPase
MSNRNNRYIRQDSPRPPRYTARDSSPRYNSPDPAARDADHSGTTALNELFRVREDLGSHRRDLNDHEGRISETAERLTILKGLLQPLIDGWTSVASCDTVEEAHTIAMKARAGCDKLEHTVNRLDEDFTRLGTRVSELADDYDKGGKAFRNLANRVDALEKAVNHTPLANRISGPITLKTSKK